jgi:hypothetical protein
MDGGNQVSQVANRLTDTLKKVDFLETGSKSFLIQK